MHHFNETETQWTYRGPWAFYLLQNYFTYFNINLQRVGRPVTCYIYVLLVTFLQTYLSLGGGSVAVTRWVSSVGLDGRAQERLISV